MIRSIQIIPSFSGYGADKLVINLHVELTKLGVQSEIISVSGINETACEDIICFGLNNPYHPKMPILLSNHINKTGADFDKPIIVHSHLTPCQLWTPLAALFSNLKCILITTEHSTNNRRRKMLFGKLVDRYIYNPYKCIICISKGAERAIGDWQPWFKHKLVTIENGVNLGRYRPNRDRKNKTDKPIVISVGRLHNLKNYVTAINAIKILDGIDFEYRIIGDGNEQPELERLIKNLGLQNKVKLLGYRKDVADQLNRADIFLMPSLWEGFGLSAVEAMATGLPSVVGNVPGLREVVGLDEKCGYLINPRDHINLAERLRILLIDKDLRLEMGNEAMRKSQHYSIEKTAVEYRKLYSYLMAQHGGESCRD